MLHSLLQSGNEYGYPPRRHSPPPDWDSYSPAKAAVLHGIKLAGWTFGTLALAYVGWVAGEATVHQHLSRETLTHLEQRHSQRAPQRRVRLPAPEFQLADLDIPRIGLAVMVSEGTDEGTLRLGAGHLPGSGVPGRVGNVVIAGHRDTFFRSLRQIRVGDTIDLTSPDGTYHYRVEWTRIVDPEDTQTLGPTSTPALTLVTCYPFRYVGSAPERFVVRAFLSAPHPGIQEKRFGS